MTMDIDGKDSVFAAYYESGQQLYLSDAIDQPNGEDEADGRTMNPAEEFAQFVIDQMEKGTLPPWAKPWDTSRMPFPCNWDGRPYGGVNSIYLEFLSIVRGYRDHRWLTKNRVEQMGGRVRPGERYTPVVFSMSNYDYTRSGRRLNYGETRALNPESHSNVSHEPSDDRTAEGEYVPSWYSHRVYNVDQCEGLPESFLEDGARQIRDVKPIAEAEKVARNYLENGGPSVRYAEYGGPYRMGPIRSGGATYRPSQDLITVPAPDRYGNINDHYATLFHEIGHSTGHRSRLNRPGLRQESLFGSHEYGVEELIAEMTSAILCRETLTVADPLLEESAASYISGWIGTIKEAPSILWRAASAAHRASDHVLSFSVS